MCYVDDLVKVMYEFACEIIKVTCLKNPAMYAARESSLPQNRTINRHVQLIQNGAETSAESLFRFKRDSSYELRA